MTAWPWPEDIDAAAIVREILKGYTLPVRGDHGVVHWARVLENALRLAPLTGARLDVVTLFALLHDSRRFNEYTDPDHGRRGAELAAALRGACFAIDDRGLGLLQEACRHHTEGRIDADPTVQACWDADRLDLGRVGISPSPRRLCTDAARGLLEWSHHRASTGFEPSFVRQSWGT